MKKQGGIFMKRSQSFIGIVFIILLGSFWFPQMGPAEDQYTVKKGDTLSSISKSIEIKSYAIKKGDNFYSISKRVGIPVEEIKKMNQLRSSNLRIGQILKLTKTMDRAEEIKDDLTEVEGTIGERLEEGNGDKNGTSEPLGKWSNPEERTLMVKVVKTFLGVPYRMGGSTIKGIDCSALVKKVYQIFNIDLPRTAREQFSIGRKVEKKQLKEGDLVFFSRQGNNAHVGIYIGNNEFVHASWSNKGVKIDNLEAPYYNKRFLGGVRVKDLES
jgi:peptidoglycan endopeptidase LytE